jgi:TRAP-type C4-dicarboxylate transport system substrate-binding protein
MSETTEKVRAPKRTPRRAIEEAGFGHWWKNLTDADKEAVAEHLRTGTAAVARADFDREQREAEKRLAAAAAKVDQADKAEQAWIAVVDKCRQLQATLDRK